MAPECLNVSNSLHSICLIQLAFVFSGNGWQMQPPDSNNSPLKVVFLKIDQEIMPEANL